MLQIRTHDSIFHQLPHLPWRFLPFPLQPQPRDPCPTSAAGRAHAKTSSPSAANPRSNILDSAPPSLTALATTASLAGTATSAFTPATATMWSAAVMATTTSTAATATMCLSVVRATTCLLEVPVLTCYLMGPEESLLGLNPFPLGCAGDCCNRGFARRSFCGGQT